MPPSLNPPNAVPSNAFESVVLGGILRHAETKELLALTFHRSTPEPNEPLLFDPPGVIGEEPPERLPSQLPSPGNLQLNLQAVKVIGKGRVATVCEVAIRYNSSSSEIHKMLMPPLVIKISRPYDAYTLTREAYYYEEMECLQGSVIPRYYGVYEATIPENGEFKLWNSDFLEEERERQEQLKKRPGRPVPEIPRPTLVRILILERLGDLIPLCKPLPSNVKTELRAMYADMARLSIDQDDIRYYNILRAPAPRSSPLPSLPSPFTQRKYQWRIIDFDRARKSNKDEHLHAGVNNGYLERLLINLPYGDIWEPWH